MTKDIVKDRTLDDREESILGAIVYDYITTGKPVGSRSFVQKYSFSISPATMRNIMFDLERIGYLMQPHTSAGRIPTDYGYRFYVNSLLDNYNFSLKENISVNEDLLKSELQLDKLFASVTKTISSLTKYAAIMMTPQPDFAVVKRIELVLLDNNEVLIIIITRTGMIMTKKVNLSMNFTQDELYDYSRFLTAELSGYSIHDINESVLDRLREESVMGMKKGMVIDMAQLAMSENRESGLNLDGIENLLKIPEMVQEERLNSLLNIIEERNILKNIMERMLNEDGIQILIGKEINEERVEGCSIVTSAYKIGNKNVGVIGVFGPTRMDYEKVVPLVDYTGSIISDYLTRMSM